MNDVDHCRNFACSYREKIDGPNRSRENHRATARGIRKHDRLYYQDAAPIISDREYDRLYKKLVDLEMAVS